MTKDRNAYITAMVTAGMQSGKTYTSWEAVRDDVWTSALEAASLNVNKGRMTAITAGRQTGKTALALEVAKRLMEEGQYDVLYRVPNNIMAHHIRRREREIPPSDYGREPIRITGDPLWYLSLHANDYSNTVLIHDEPYVWMSHEEHSFLNRFHASLLIGTPMRTKLNQDGSRSESLLEWATNNTEFRYRLVPNLRVIEQLQVEGDEQALLAEGFGHYTPLTKEERKIYEENSAWVTFTE